MIQLSFILPVHNEADIISLVYRDIRRAADRLNIAYECILVENGSTDNSIEMVRKLVKKFAHTKVVTAPRGYGSAILAGLAAARGKYVCYMPSDGQIDLSVISKLWRLVQTGNWDVVKVRRVTRESWDRLAFSSLFSFTVSMLFGVPRYDINGSPRILLRHDMEKLHVEHTDSFIDTEFAVRAKALGWNIKEIPMRTLQRRGGVSTRGWHTYWEFIKNLYMFRIYHI